jgi:hypothetical protein
MDQLIQQIGTLQQQNSKLERRNVELEMEAHRNREQDVELEVEVKEKKQGIEGPESQHVIINLPCVGKDILVVVALFLTA